MINIMKKLGFIKTYKATIDLNLIAYYITSETYTRFYICLKYIFCSNRYFILKITDIINTEDDNQGFDSR